MSQQLDINQINEQFSEKVASAPSLNGSINITITGIGSIYLENIDGNNTCSVKDQQADCLISMSPETFAQLASGEVSSMAAFMQGKLNVSGDMSIAMSLASFL